MTIREPVRTKMLYSNPPVYVRWKDYNSHEDDALRAAFLTIETWVVDEVDSESEGIDVRDVILEYHIGFYIGGGTQDVTARWHTYLDYGVSNWGDPNER